jgi:hypothetical protein
VLGAIVRLTATVLCTAATGAGPICAGVASAFVAGLTSGDFGEALKVGLIATATAHAFTAVGDMTGTFPGAPHGGHAPLDFGSLAHMFNMAGHAAVGCASAAVAGGR